ncbi:hypothetical protein BCR33DRAFT_762498 [Rhizoclosmatium globosum]|uniref:UBR-type domain-containing protein n=1 Tax=Rhizoclosmatium globosum TaxID=329046 RepID=A0A1Y2CV88_9FUNG|nr:hypothetical protein BCR33DRAFT_762498 [Rhizoclosmatium globosum]|eukprot:ORY50932.1 hypothetical protein BCR33DRAFT_762498 [Rhizoclosmatium globosum]
MFVRRRRADQQIFSCLTCRGPETNANVGVCYACFVQCHTSHEVVELFERRDFVCDCGSSVCPVKCTLQQKSVGVLNSTNKYDHCFNNIFCYCKQPYDHEKEPDDSFMMHCIVCEDWFHDRCVKNCPDEDAFDEFVCKNCVANNPWLWTYENLTENMVFVGEDEDDVGDSGNGKEKLSKLMTPSRKRQASTENDTDTDSLQPPSSVNKRVRQSTSSPPHLPPLQHLPHHPHSHPRSCNIQLPSGKCFESSDHVQTTRSTFFLVIR